jgi:hypothetical protein
MRKLVVATLAVIVMFTILGSVVSAHHSRAGYAEAQTEMKGVVTSVAWRNPHVYVMFNVKDDKGAVKGWTGELSSVTSMLAAGMARDTLKPGDEIVVRGAIAENGTPQALLAAISRADGTVVVSENYRRDTR